MVLKSHHIQEMESSKYFRVLIISTVSIPLFIYLFFVLFTEYKNLKCNLGARFSVLGYKKTIIPQSVIPCPSDWFCANLHLNIKTESLPFNLNQFLPGNGPVIFESQHCVPPMNCSDICRIAGLDQLSEVLECEHHCCSHDLCNAEWRKGGE